MQKTNRQLRTMLLDVEKISKPNKKTVNQFNTRKISRGFSYKYK